MLYSFCCTTDVDNCSIYVHMRCTWVMDNAELWLWIMNDVCPIFKKGSKLWDTGTTDRCYLHRWSRKWPKVLFERITNFWVEIGAISASQDGFVLKKSCITNLLEALDIMTMAMYEGYSIDVIYTDFSKAFEKVPHKLLIPKLKAFGISENIISWIDAWLRYRVV